MQCDAFQHVRMRCTTRQFMASSFWTEQAVAIRSGADAYLFDLHLLRYWSSSSVPLWQAVSCVITKIPHLLCDGFIPPTGVFYGVLQQCFFFRVLSQFCGRHSWSHVRNQLQHKGKEPLVLCTCRTSKLLFCTKIKSRAGLRCWRGEKHNGPSIFQNYLDLGIHKCT